VFILPNPYHHPHSFSFPIALAGIPKAKQAVPLAFFLFFPLLKKLAFGLLLYVPFLPIPFFLSPFSFFPHFFHRMLMLRDEGKPKTPE